MATNSTLAASQCVGAVSPPPSSPFRDEVSMSSLMSLPSLAALAALGGFTACAGGPVGRVAEVRASSVLFIAPHEVAAAAATNAEDRLRRRRPLLLLPRALHGQPSREGTPL